MPTMNLPGIGAVEKKYVYIGAALIAGIAGYAYYRSRSAASSDTSGTDTTGTDTGTDPGQSDLSATYSGTDYGSYNYAGSGPVYQSPVNQVIPITSDQQITTNSDWYSAGVESLAEEGVDRGAAGSALSHFLSNLCVSEVQADFVRRAEGAHGRPPQSPNLQIKICSVTPPGGGGTGTPAKVSGFHVTGSDKSGVTLAWTAVKDADYYHLSDGTHGYTVTGTHSRVGNLKRKHNYTFTIYAVNEGKHGASSTAHGKTK